MSNQQRNLYEFGPFRFDPARPRLTRDGEIISLTPKALEILLVLVQDGGTLVEKEELMRKVWPDTFVEEGNLSVHIFALRKALGETIDGKGYIETIPKLGYRFIGSVQEIAPNGAELVVERHTLSRVVVEEELETAEDVVMARQPLALLPSDQTSHVVFWRRPSVMIVVLLVLSFAGVLTYLWLSQNTKPPATSAEVKSMAVLPFKTLGGEASDEYLGLGLADALITQLSRTQQITVRPTSAVRKYVAVDQDAVAVGQALGVEAVLEGSVQRAGERIRVTVSLLRASDGVSLWVAKFDEKFTDIFTVQDAISNQVAKALLIDLTSGERQLLTKRYTENTEAYLEYLKGRYFWSKRTANDAEKAIQHFEQAIALDPNYALAYSGLADSYAIRTALPPRVAIPRAMAAALKALELDAELAEGHVSLATIKELYEWDKAGAEREYKRAIELNPNYTLAHGLYSMYLTSMGRFDEGAAEAKRAEELDPLSPNMYIYAGWNFYNSRQYDRSIEEAQKAIHLDPNVSMAYNILVRAYAAKKMYTDAISLGQTLRSSSEQKELMLSKERPLSLASLGYAYAVSGKTQEAHQILEELKELSAKTYVSPNHLAVIYAGLGDKERVLEYLEKTFEERDEMQRFVKVSPIFDSLHLDPRFLELLRRVGLTPE